MFTLELFEAFGIGQTLFQLFKDRCTFWNLKRAKHFNSKRCAHSVPSGFKQQIQTPPIILTIRGILL